MENEEPKVILSYAMPDIDELTYRTYRIACRQKWMSYAIFLKLIFLIPILINPGFDPTVISYLLLANVVISIGAFFTTVALSFVLFSSQLLGIIWGLVSFVPILGLALMLMINDSAVYKLRHRGLKVGLFGTNLKEARRVAAMAAPDITPPQS